MAAYPGVLAISLPSYMTARSLRIQFLTVLGVAAGTELTATFTEIGGGWYLWSGNIPQTGPLAYEVREVGQAAVLGVGTLDAPELDAYLSLTRGTGYFDGTGAAAPDECDLYVTVRGNGQWQQNVRVTCESASPPDVADGAVVYSARETLRTGSDGRATFTRARGLLVRVTVPDSAVDVTLTVPDAASYNIALSI